MPAREFEVDPDMLRSGGDSTNHAGAATRKAAARLEESVAAKGIFGDFDAAHAFHSAFTAGRDEHVRRMRAHDSTLTDISRKASAAGRAVIDTDEQRRCHRHGARRHPCDRHLSQYVNFSEAELAADAGDDPWKLNGELKAGDAGAINDLADAFHQSGMHVNEADDEFNAAKRDFQNAYRVNEREHPINDSSEVQRVSAALKGHPEELSRIAVELEQLAAALALGQRNSEAEIASLQTYLHTVDDQITADPDSRDTLYPAAVDATKAAAGHLQEIRGAYVAQLDGAEAAMTASGYAPDVIDGLDGVAGNAPQEVAQRYERSGQRAKDQAMVDAARAAGRTRDLASMAGRPGYITNEEADAAGRLRDYDGITDPSHGYAHTAHAHGDDRPARLAAQRLDDYMMANSTGPVAKDPVLGGDARTRAQARVNLQRDLENGNLSWSQQPKTPDDATQLMDRMEVTDRANVLTRLQEELQQVGMTPDGGAAATESMAHGTIPQEIVDAASAAGKPIAGEKEAFDRMGESLPTGRHWGPEVSVFSTEDAEALKRIGSRLGVVGNVLDLGVGLYEWHNGASGGEVIAKTGGSMAGAWGGGALGAEVGAVGGPPGVFIGALIGGTAGAIIGEDAGEAAYEWMTGDK